MGQYWYPVNLDKREFIHPHRLGAGLKLWEQIANHPGVGAALVILCADMPEPRGGGDFDLDDNWHGPERTFPEHNAGPGPMPTAYPNVARQTIGRWAGDRIALVGDYAAQGDRCGWNPATQQPLYLDCGPDDDGTPGLYTDITDLVCAVIEHELSGRYEGDGWRDFVKGI